MRVLRCADQGSTTERLLLPPLRAVAQVDLSRYLGTWCEIASLPQRFSYAVVGHPGRGLVRTLQVAGPPAASAARAPERS